MSVERANIQRVVRRPGRGASVAGAAAGPTAHGRSLAIVRDPLRILLVALTVVSISRIHGFIGLSALRPALVLFVLALGYAVLNAKALNTAALLRTWPAKVMAGLAVMACLSVPLSISIGGSAAFIVGTYAKVLLYAFLVVLAIRHVRDLYTFVLAYVISCGILVVLAVGVVGISKTAGVGMYDANDLGLVLLVGLPLALAVFQSTDSRVVKFLSGATVAGTGVAMALSMSRGGFLGLLAVGLGLLFLLKRVSVAKRIGFVAIAATAVLIAAPAGYWESMSTILSPTEDYNWENDYGRRQVWTRGIGYMLSNPVTGIGVNSYPRAEGTLSEVAERVNLDPSAPGRIKWSAAHNSFLQAGAEMGIPGLVLFSWLVVGGMVAMFKLRKRLPRQWARGDPQERFLYHLALYLPVSFLAFAVTGSFVSFAYLEPVYLLAAYMAGLYAAAGVMLRRPQSAVASGGRRPPKGWRVHGPHDTKPDQIASVR